MQERLQTLPDYLSQTEDDRLALALLALFNSPHFGPPELRTWSAQYRTLWADLEAGKIPPSVILALRTLHSLHTLLHLGATINGTSLFPAYPKEAAEAVLDAIKSFCPHYGQTRPA